MQNRFRPSVEAAGRLIADGGLGEIVSVGARLSNFRPQSYYDEAGRGTRARDGGGVLLTQGIHTLDAMIALVGLPLEVVGLAKTSRAHRMETEDVAHAVCALRAGLSGRSAPPRRPFPAFDAIDIFGTRGSLRFDADGADLWLVDGPHRRIDDGASSNGAGADPMAFSGLNHQRVLADFLEAVAHHRTPRVSGREALKVHALIEAILASSEAHGQPVPVRI